MSLQGSRCPGCGRTAVPGEVLCLACGEGTEACAVEAAGTVLARTQRPGRPWVVLVELEGGARVLARWAVADAAGDAAGDAAADEAPAVGGRVGLIEEEGQLVARLG